MIEYLDICIIFSILFMISGLTIRYNKKPKKLKRTKNRKSKPGYYNTGYKFSLSLKDVIKFKVRLNDYCDKQGIRFNHLIAMKIFNFEFCRMKYTDQKGRVYKRKIRFGS